MSRFRPHGVRDLGPHSGRSGCSGGAGGEAGIDYRVDGTASRRRHMKAPGDSQQIAFAYEAGLVRPGSTT
jgi:hypothetical protein